MSLTLIGKKRGMTRLFDKKRGKVIPCTVIEIEPNIVSQIKTIEIDEYNGIQLAAFKVAENHTNRITKPILGHFEKNKISPCRVMSESRLDSLESFEIGKEITVEFFSDIEFVDVCGTSKGKGYQGVIKRFGVARKPESHGSGPIVRHMGSTGSLTSHGRVQKNKKGAGQMGNERVTCESLQVICVKPELNALVVKGAVPGANGGVVYIRKAIKKLNRVK